MSVLQTLRTMLGLGSEPEQNTGAQTLVDLLAEREESMRLTAVYGQPTVNMVGEPTAVFPATLYHDGEEYGVTNKEFPLPDNGLSDEDAPLTRFLAQYGITERSAIHTIEGIEESATLDDDGNVTINVGGADDGE